MNQCGCGQELREQARFCPRCGHATGATAPRPPDGPPSLGGSRSAWLVVGGALAMVATVLAVVLIARPEAATAEGEAPTAAPGVSTDTSAPIAARGSTDPAGPAGPAGPAETLEQTRRGDATALEAVTDRWIPQLSAKKAGLIVDGRVLDDAAVVADHQALRGRYPQARLLWSGDFTSFVGRDFWVTVVATPFDTAGEANAWCDQRGLPADQCYAKKVSRTSRPEVSTQHR